MKNKNYQGNAQQGQQDQQNDSDNSKGSSPDTGMNDSDKKDDGTRNK